MVNVVAKGRNRMRQSAALAKSDGGVTALIFALANGHFEMAQLLVRDGTADVEAKTNDRWSAMHGSSESGGWSDGGACGQ
jgi:hypothetical protein